MLGGIPTMSPMNDPFVLSHIANEHRLSKFADLQDYFDKPMMFDNPYLPFEHPKDLGSLEELRAALELDTFEVVQPE